MSPRDRRNRTFSKRPGEEDITRRGSPLDRLTDRETEVLSLVAEGKTNKEISFALYITVDTVKAHITRIMYKLNVRNRTEATIVWKEAHGPGSPILESEVS